MNISPLIPLLLGSIAFILFLGVLTTAAILTFRNRHTIKESRRDSHE